jgi:hypothetical protein
MQFFQVVNILISLHYIPGEGRRIAHSQNVVSGSVVRGAWCVAAQGSLPCLVFLR